MSSEGQRNSNPDYQAKDDKQTTLGLPRHFMPFICYYLIIAIFGTVVLVIDQYNSANYLYSLFQYFTCLKTCQNKFCLQYRDRNTSTEEIITVLKSVYYSLLASLTILFIIPTKEFSECYFVFKSKVKCQEVQSEQNSLPNGTDNNSIPNVDQNGSKSSQTETAHSSDQVRVQASVMI